MNTIKKLFPGTALSLVVAAVAWFIAKIPVGVINTDGSVNTVGSYIGASVIALFIGMILNRYFGARPAYKPGFKFTSKKILKFAIILLGASMTISTVLKVITGGHVLYSAHMLWRRLFYRQGSRP